MPVDDEELKGVEVESSVEEDTVEEDADDFAEDAADEKDADEEDEAAVEGTPEPGPGTAPLPDSSSLSPLEALEHLVADKTTHEDGYVIKVSHELMARVHALLIGA